MTNKSNTRFYVTTPIYYPNDIPHIGHAYTTIAADILARWHKLLGNEVFFLTGTDEHGKKIEQTAQKHGKKPKEFVDELIPKFKDAWKKLNIEYTKFIRTTDPDHKKVVQEILKKVYKKGDIYLGEYEGLYCTECESYYLEKDVQNKLCPIHKKPLELLKEKSYFFKLSKYQKELLELYEKNPDFILPKFRRQEVINRVKNGLNDLSISRTSFKWGIEIPFDKNHITYVWFDALTNYLTGIEYGKDKKKFNKYWPADIHIVGKDILWFHSVIWPAILISAGIKPPKTVFAHGWWTFDKEKISKSGGKVINVDGLVSIAGVDSARYFLFRETNFGNDGDFSSQALIERNNSELANKLGNLVSRVSALAETYGLKKTGNKLAKKLNVKKIEKYFDNYELDLVLGEIFSFVDVCNEYIQTKKPWEEKTKNRQEILYELSDSIKSIAILLSPFIPETSEKISKVFNFKISYKEIKTPLKLNKIKKAPILFQKIEVKEEKVNKIQDSDKSEKITGVITMSQINFNEWEKIDLRVGQILKAEDIEGTDKIYKLSVDLGELGKRTICAGIKECYSKDELKGKQIIVFTNLAPRVIRGIKSEGMLLAAVSEDHKKIVLISPEKNIGPGTKVQ
ncbi:MAG: methionine--tRNA ligase [Candidatus Pacearchaeota archaeon]